VSQKCKGQTLYVLEELLIYVKSYTVFGPRLESKEFLINTTL